MKKAKSLIASDLTIVDEEGNPRIAMHAFKSYAGISFYKGVGKKRYQALQIYISEHHDGMIEIWNGAFTTTLTLGAQSKGAGLSIFDAEGKFLKGVGAFYGESKPAEKKKTRANRSKT